MGFFDGAGAAIINNTGSWLSSVWQNSMNRKNAKWELNNITPRMMEYNKDMYSFQAEQDYLMARQYAENSAKWSVDGLRNAGLNPILAATDGSFNGTYGSGGGSMGGLDSPSVSGVDAPRFKFTDAIRDVASARSADAQADIQTATKDSVKDQIDSQVALQNANSAKVAAEADKIRAETEYLRRNSGLNNEANIIGRILSSTTDAVRKFRDFVYDDRHSAKSDDGDVIRLEDGRSHSAKDSPFVLPVHTERTLPLFNSPDNREIKWIRPQGRDF